MSAQQAEPRVDLRERIIITATRLFADQGFSATSVRQLVEGCECTKPALYYYFESKDALYREVVQRHLDDYSRMIGQWTASDKPVREACHLVLDSFIDYGQEKPEVLRLLQRVELQPEDDAPEFNIVATRQQHLEILSELLERGIASAQLRANLLASDCALLIAGAMTFQCEISVAEGVWDRQRIHRTLDLLFDGISS